MDDVKLGFKKATYHKGDVMVIHAKEHGLVVGIYMVLEDIPEEYIEDTWDKWPYKYMLRCLTPDFSKKWWQEEIKTLELPEDFIIHRLHEEDHVTMRRCKNCSDCIVFCIGVYSEDCDYPCCCGRIYEYFYCMEFA